MTKLDSASTPPLLSGDQLNALTHLLEPLREKLHTYVLRHPLIGADETTWRLMGRPGSARWTVWALCTSRPDAGGGDSSAGGELGRGRLSGLGQGPPDESESHA